MNMPAPVPAWEKEQAEEPRSGQAYARLCVHETPLEGTGLRHEL